MAEINVAAAVTESAEITTPILQTIMEFLNSSIAQDGEPVCPCEVLFERMTDKGLSMAIQQSSSGLPNRYDQNIVGSYTVDLPFKRAFNPHSRGYDCGNADNWIIGEYTRIHRDIDIINAMRKWLYSTEEKKINNTELYTTDELKAVCDEKCLICNEESKRLDKCIFCNFI